MQRSFPRSRNTRIRKQPYRRRVSSPLGPSIEATSIHVRDLPASANEQSLYQWCQRTVCKGLKIDQFGLEKLDFISDIWIGKPVLNRNMGSDGLADPAPSKLRYAHVRFQHKIFRTLMLEHAQPEDFDGSSRPLVSLTPLYGEKSATKRLY